MVQMMQIKSLIDYLELHPEMAHGRMARTMEGRCLARKLWSDCATMLRAVCVEGPHKTADEWRLFFNEYKSKMFRKIKALKAAKEGTGKGKIKSVYLTPLQERLFGILGWDINDPLAALTHKDVSGPDLTVQLEEEEEEQMDSPATGCKESPPQSPSTPGSSISSYCANPKKRRHDTSDNITKQDHTINDNISNRQYNTNDNNTHSQYNLNDSNTNKQYNTNDSITSRQYNSNDNNTNGQYNINDNIPNKRHCGNNENIINNQHNMSDNINNRQYMNDMNPANTNNHHGISVPQLDRFDYMAKTWSETLRILPNEQRIIAEKIINEVFFEAQLKTLTRESRLLVQNTSNNSIITHIKIE